jgi:hypothetical protein
MIPLTGKVGLQMYRRFPLPYQQSNTFIIQLITLLSMQLDLIEISEGSGST